MKTFNTLFKEISENSIDVKMDASYKHFQRFRQNVKIENINMKLVEDFYNYMLGLYENDTLALSTIYKYFESFRSALRILADNNYPIDLETISKKFNRNPNSRFIRVMISEATYEMLNKMKKEKKVSKKEIIELAVFSFAKNKHLDKEYLSIEEAAELLGVSRSSMMRLLDKGEIEYTKLGGRVIIAKKNIDKLF